MCSFGGGLAVGVAYYLGVILASPVPLSKSPDQIYLIALGGVGGLMGSVIDSILGATVQVKLNCYATVVWLDNTHRACIVTQS